MRGRILLLATVLVVGGACAGGGLEGVSGDKHPVVPSSEVAPNIPPPGAVATQAPPELPDRGPSMPSDTISLEEMHRQGRTDVMP